MNRHELGRLLDGVDCNSSEHFQIYTMLDPVKFYAIVGSELSQHKFIRPYSREIKALAKFNQKTRKRPKDFHLESIVEKRRLRNSGRVSQELYLSGITVQENVLIVSSNAARILGFWFHTPSATKGKSYIRATTLREHPKRAEEVIAAIRAQLAKFTEK